MQIKLQLVKLEMNEFPGWVDEPDWEKVFLKKVTDIENLYLKFSDNVKSLKTRKLDGFVEIIGASANTALNFSKSNLLDGKYEVVIDKVGKKASIEIGGIFEVNVDHLEKQEIAALIKHTHLFADGFSFSNAKGADTSAQGHFTNSWDAYVEIGIEFVD